MAVHQGYCFSVIGPGSGRVVTQELREPVLASALNSPGIERENNVVLFVEHLHELPSEE